MSSWTQAPKIKVEPKESKRTPQDDSLLRQTWSLIWKTQNGGIQVLTIIIYRSSWPSIWRRRLRRYFKCQWWLRWRLEGQQRLRTSLLCLMILIWLLTWSLILDIKKLLSPSKEMLIFKFKMILRMVSMLRPLWESWHQKAPELVSNSLI